MSPIAAVGGGQDDRRAVEDDPEVADQAGVEDGVQLGAVGAGAAGAAADRAARRRGQGCGGGAGIGSLTCSACGRRVASCEGHSASIRERPLVDLPPLVLDRTAARRSPCSSPTHCGRRRGRERSGWGTGCRRPGRSRVDLAVSRTVTAAAYDQLLAEGWVAGGAARGRSWWRCRRARRDRSRHGATRARPARDARGRPDAGRPAGPGMPVRRGAGPARRGGGPGAPPPTSRPTSCPTRSACPRSGPRSSSTCCGTAA